jgi:N-dimethylarginine dimethylaminohydrolase
MRVLMGKPHAFDVVEVINVHMADASGELNPIDRNLAQSQWRAVAEAYNSIGVEVSTIDAGSTHQDAVFTANPSMALPLPNKGLEVWLGKMAHPSRRGETAFHQCFFDEADITTRTMPATVSRFEGCGDAIHHPGRFLLHAGTGPRTSADAWHALADAHADLDILLYPLQDERFYHLDTALAPITESCAMFVRSAFDANGLELLHAAFSDLIEVTESEALHFAANAHCPDGKHVLIQSGCSHIEAELRSRGFTPIPLETSEFIKSGGSVFCMKQSY